MPLIYKIFTIIYAGLGLLFTSIIFDELVSGYWRYGNHFFEAVLGLSCLLSAYGLIQMTSWALWLTRATAGFWIIYCIRGIFLTMLSLNRGLDILFGFIFGLPFLIYFSRKTISGYFKKDIRSTSKSIPLNGLKPKCSKCGAMIEPNMKFCGKCGEKLFQNQAVVNADTQIPRESIMSICPKCGKQYSKKIMYCPECGTNIKVN